MESDDHFVRQIDARDLDLIFEAPSPFPKPLTIMARTIKFAEVFQLVDNGLSKRIEVSSSSLIKLGRARNDNNSNKSVSAVQSPHDSTKNLPVCLYGPHKSKGYRPTISWLYRLSRGRKENST